MNTISKIVKLKDIPVGNFEGIVEQTMLISPSLMPSIVHNTDVIHGLKEFTYFSTGYYLPNSGPSSHPHENVDVVTFIINSSVVHDGTIEDNVIVAGPKVHVQRAGKGIKHTEKNINNENARFIQMWFTSPYKGMEPEYLDININNSSLTTVLGGNNDKKCFSSTMTCKIGTLKKGDILKQDGECIVFILEGNATCTNTNILEGEMISINNLSLIANTDIQLVLVY